VKIDPTDPMPVPLRHATVETDDHDVVEQVAPLVIAAVVVRWYEPKLRPEIVTEVTPEATPFELVKMETTGESKLRALSLVPTAAETVTTIDLV
jgi:hypothetical protein